MPYSSRRRFLQGSLALGLLGTQAYGGTLPLLGAGGSLGPSTPTVTIDAIATPATGTGVQTLSLNMTVGASANAMLIPTNFSYSNHTNFQLTWTVGATVQTFTAGTTFYYLVTSDNGASAPSIALIGLLNPTLGAGTLTMSFNSAADNPIMGAVTFNNVNTLGGLSGAFAAGIFGTGTSTATSLALPSSIPGGLQCAFAAGISGSPTTWNQGATLYSATAGSTWGSGVYGSALTPAFSLGINSSVFWSAAGVVINPVNKFPTGTLAINAAHPLAPNLTFVIPCLGATTLTDLVTGKTATPIGCTTDTSGGYGGGLAIPGGSTTAKADFGVWQPIPQGDFAIFALCNPGDTTRGCIVGQCDSTPANFATLQANTNISNSLADGFFAGTVFTPSAGADDNNRQVANGTYHTGVIDGRYHTWGLRVASGVASLWCDGAKTSINTASLVGATWTNVNQHFAIGNLGNYVGAAFSAACTAVLASGVNIGPTDAQMASMTANQFQVLL